MANEDFHCFCLIDDEVAIFQFIGFRSACLLSAALYACNAVYVSMAVTDTDKTVDLTQCNHRRIYCMQQKILHR